MKKIFFGFVFFILIGALAIFWHRSHFYAVCFLMPVDRGLQTPNTTLFRGLYEAWHLGIEDAKALDKFQVSEVEIPADIDESITILKQQIRLFLARHNRWWWSDSKLLIIAGFSSRQLMAAKDEVQKCGRVVICVSPGSTTPQAASWQHVLQLEHNDTFAAQAITMFIRRKQFDKVAVLYIPHDPYSQGYSDGLIQAFVQQGVEYKTYAFDTNSIVSLVENEINSYLSDAKKPVLVFTGFSKDLIKAEKVLKSQVAIIGTDTCSDLGDVFAPEREVTVVIPAIIDYTVATKLLYQRIYQIFEKKDPLFDYEFSCVVPFMYDFAYQVGLMINGNFDLTWRYFVLRLDAAKPGAALVSSWYTPTRNGPAHGGYWFVYTHDPKTTDIRAYRKLLFGNTVTLPESAAVAYQIGYYAWAGLSGWNMYQNIWEDYYMRGTFFATKLSYINFQTSGGIINWAPFHVKQYRDKNGKWWFAGDLPDRYPLDEKKYELE